MTKDSNSFLTPVPHELKNLFEGKQASLFGNQIDFPSSDFVWEDLRRYAIVLIGIIGGANDESQLNKAREAFYSLYLHSEYLKIIDLGNILVGEGNFDNIKTVEDILANALKYNVFVIPFGKSPAYLSSCYNALKTIDKAITVTCISNTASLGNVSDVLTEQNYLAHLLEERNNGLFSLNIVAYQLFQTDPESLNLLNKYYCQTMRLGGLRADFKSVEPILRDTDILSINMSAIRQCDAPASLQSSPNGLYAEEVCQLARYGGISDRLVIAGIFGFNLDNDCNSSTSQLVAQVIWHLIDGYTAKENDNPLKNVNGIKKYIVDMGAPMRQLVFYYSSLSERWWMEVPSELVSNNLLVACSHDDYRSACNHEVPLRWVWFNQKLTQKNNAD